MLPRRPPSESASPLCAFAHYRIVRKGGAMVDLEMVYQNEASARFNRLPAGHFEPGTTILSAFPETAASEAWSWFRRVADTGEPWEGETFYRGKTINSWFRIVALRPDRDTLVVVFEDLTPRRHAEEIVARQAQHARLREEISAHVAQAASVADMLTACASSMAAHVGAAHVGAATARVWTMNADGVTLERASSAERDEPPGADVRRVATTRTPLLRNDAAADGGTVSFAGHPMMVGDRLVGVLEVRAQAPISDDTFDAIGAVAGTLALGVDRRRAEDEARDEREAIATLHRIATALTADLDLARIVQRLTDEATAVCRAQFGAFFYNVVKSTGESYMLYTLSGVPREAFASFPMPRNTAIFAPTFTGSRIVRSDDITAEPDYGKNPPYTGMPRGHLPVRSYLAVPVVSRSGEVLGGLFFGHAQPAVFTARDERILTAAAAHAAVAMDNARLFEAARREREVAEEANRLKDDFLATMSHELRTPLNAMLGWTRMLRSGALAAEKHARALEVIERSAKTQAALIEDVLDVSRIVSGKLRLDVGITDLCAVVEAAIDTVRPAAEAKNVRIQTLLDPQAGTTMGDPDRLQQVVWNLLSNAVKFTPRDGRVHVRLQRHHSSIEVVVADTGQGIAKEFLPLVFERFRQGDSTITRSHGGLGLGLAICKHLVELHGGTILAESDGPGTGATFTVRIPVSPLRATPTTPMPASPAVNFRDSKAIECPANIAGLRVLIVDDEPDARELMQSVLEHCRAEVTAVASAAEGVLAVTQFQPHVIVSDIGMPNENGYDFIRRVRELPADRGGHTPAVALTAYARLDDRTRALAAGFDNHVAKPVEPRELLAIVAALAARFGRR